MVKQRVFLIRHGQTEWSLSGQHTGLTDIPLTEAGRKEARRLQPILAAQSFARVLTSPLSRAQETAALAGFGDRAERDPDLVEWNYGQYEGRTGADIRAEAPGWIIFRDGAPGGESPAQVAARVDRLLDRVRATQGDVALFAHGHILRVVAARWIGLPVEGGQRFLLDTSTLSVLGYYEEAPAVEMWNAAVTP